MPCAGLGSLKDPLRMNKKRVCGAYYTCGYMWKCIQYKGLCVFPLEALVGSFFNDGKLALARRGQSEQCASSLHIPVVMQALLKWQHMIS